MESGNEILLQITKDLIAIVSKIFTNFTALLIEYGYDHIRENGELLEDVKCLVQVMEVLGMLPSRQEQIQANIEKKTEAGVMEALLRHAGQEETEKEYSDEDADEDMMELLRRLTLEEEASKQHLAQGSGNAESKSFSRRAVEVARTGIEQMSQRMIQNDQWREIQRSEFVRKLLAQGIQPPEPEVEPPTTHLLPIRSRSRSRRKATTPQPSSSAKQSANTKKPQTRPIKQLKLLRQISKNLTEEMERQTAQQPPEEVALNNSVNIEQLNLRL